MLSRRWTCCSADVPVHMAENIFLSMLTVFDPLVTSLDLGIFFIMHGSAIAHRGLTMSVMTLWAEFPEIEFQRIITQQYNEPLPIC